MAIVKNVRDHEVEFDPFDVQGTRVIPLSKVIVPAGETVEVPDVCAHGAPQFALAGLLDGQEDNWELVEPPKAKAKPKPATKPRAAKGDHAEKTAIEVPADGTTSPEITGDGTGEALPPADGEDA